MHGLSALLVFVVLSLLVFSRLCLFESYARIFPRFLLFRQEPHQSHVHYVREHLKRTHATRPIPHPTGGPQTLRT